MIVHLLPLLLLIAAPQVEPPSHEPLTATQPASVSATPSSTEQKPTIPDGTEVQLILSETLSSKKHVKGDLFQLAVSDDVSIDGALVLPKGTVVIGEITRAETKAAFGVSGKLEARLLYAELPTGTLRLTGRIGNKGKTGTAETVITYAAIGSIAFVVTGKSAEIPEGTELVARIGGP